MLAYIQFRLQEQILRNQITTYITNKMVHQIALPPIRFDNVIVAILRALTTTQKLY